MSDITVTMKKKGLGATGITDDVARSYANRLGSIHLAIVEYRVDSVATTADDHEKVELMLTEVEPVLDGNLNGTLSEHVREIKKALYRNRGEKDGDQPLDGVDDPGTTAKALEANGQALLDRDDDGKVVGLWDGADKPFTHPDA